MIETSTGNILDSDAQAIVNPVNCVGHMGAGLAYEFFKRHKWNYWAYADECHAERLKPGGLFVTNFDGRIIINFATKDHWRKKSELPWISSGLTALVAEVKARGIKSIAIPALGCGLGWLKWKDVLPLIERAAGEMPDVRVIVYPPQDNTVSRPKL